jgi:hypothetical protein
MRLRSERFTHGKDMHRTAMNIAFWGGIYIIMAFIWSLLFSGKPMGVRIIASLILGAVSLPVIAFVLIALSLGSTV